MIIFYLLSYKLFYAVSLNSETFMLDLNLKLFLLLKMYKETSKMEKSEFEISKSEF